IFARIPFVDGVYLTEAIAPCAFPAQFRKHCTQNLEQDCLGGSDRARRRLYFNLLEAYLCERLPEIRGSQGGIVERRTSYRLRCASVGPYETPPVVTGTLRKRRPSRYRQ